MHTAFIFISMLGAAKYARSNRFWYACAMPVSMHGATVFDNHMLGATVFDMHAWQSKYAQGNRINMRARLNEVCTVKPFSICHARCCEVCTEHACSSHRIMHGATVLYACSVQRSMHGATVFDMHARWSEVCTEHPVLTFVLGAAKYAQSNQFWHACSGHRSMHGATVLYEHARSFYIHFSRNVNKRLSFNTSS